jgi:uncharacterized membrane protein YdjX (TVP38/TMEM64 family)
MHFILTLIGGAASIVGFAVMEGIAGTVVGLVGGSILAFEVLTNLFNPPRKKRVTHEIIYRDAKSLPNSRHPRSSLPNK